MFSAVQTSIQIPTECNIKRPYFLSSSNFKNIDLNSVRSYSVLDLKYFSGVLTANTSFRKASEDTV